MKDWTDKHLAHLRLLLREYGIAGVIARARETDPSKLGRPATERFSQLKRMWLAQAVEACAAEYQGRYRNPVTEAISAYSLAHDLAFDTVKKAYYKGRQEIERQRKIERRFSGQETP